MPTETQLTRCKAFGHPWDLMPIPNRRPTEWGSLITLRCACGCTRDDTLSEFTGELLNRSYSQSEEYAALPKDWTKDMWRKEYIRLARSNRASARKAG